MVTTLPDGLVAVVKRACPTCETVAPVLGRLAHDPRVPNVRDKCRVLYFLTQRGRSVPKESYATTPGIDCSQLPPEQYPWEAPSSAKPSEKRSSM